MRLLFIVLATLVACAPPTLHRPSPPVATFRELLDSLATAGGCPDAQLPPLTPLAPPAAASVTFSPAEQCGVVLAAIRRLGREAPVEPYWAPEDTAKIAGATVFAAVMSQADSNGTFIGGPDTIARVELDVRGRPKLVWFTYSLAPRREQMGAVHRGAL